MQHHILVMSDLSGPSVAPGFEVYLTGYPLPEEGLYAFARTWYASEMNRPGCVWTHTLLIDFESLATLSDLSILVRLFRRPMPSKGKLEGYDTPLEVDTGSALAMKGTVNKGKAALLMDALYGHGDRPVLLPAGAADEHEEMALAIWSQQWPSLRRYFTFCTGSLSSRALGKEFFQLQVVPESAVSSVGRSLDDPLVVGSCLGDSSASKRRWVFLAVDDLISCGDTQWRQRLSDIGRELPGERRYFPLAATLAAWQAPSRAMRDAASLVEFLAQELGGEDADRELVGCLLELCFTPERTTVFGIGRGRLLEELSLGRQVWDLDVSGFSIRKKAKELSRRRPQEASELLLKLLKRETNPLGKELLQSIASAFATRPSAKTISELREALPVLASLNPEIGTMPQTWRGPCDQCYEILDAVARHGKASAGFHRRVTQAILAAQQDRLAWQLVRRFGDEVLVSLLDWFNASEMQEPDSLCGSWREVLIASSDVTVSWLQRSSSPIRIATIGLVSTYLDPNSGAVRNVDAAKWLDCFHREFDEVPDRIYDRASAFVLTISMATAGPASKEIIVATFERVHDAVMRSRLSDDAWDWISLHVPHLGLFRDWDRAERLRRGVIELFSNRDWPPVELAQAAVSLESWRYLVRSCRKTKKGKRILRDLQRLSTSDKGQLSEEKIRILKEVSS